MKPVFNNTFFKFLLGFIGIVLLSFAITGFFVSTSEFPETTSQTACQNDASC